MLSLLKTILKLKQKEPKKLWGIYTQYQPEYKYEEVLESIWDSKERAILEAKKNHYIQYHDFVWVKELSFNSDCIVREDQEVIRIK
jgi:hypothetical protein